MYINRETEKKVQVTEKKYVIKINGVIPECIFLGKCLIPNALLKLCNLPCGILFLCDFLKLPIV